MKIYLVQYIIIIELVYREYNPLVYKINIYRGKKENK